MPVRNVYLKIEAIHDYSPVVPDAHGAAPIAYARDCMRNAGHEDGTIPKDEINARRLTALVYREYFDHHWLLPKPDKIIFADVNEPAFLHRVPGVVIYAQPGERLRIHVKNADVEPHSFHLHGLSHGIDSDGSWPFGLRSSNGRRSDEICPGQTWIYTFDVRDDMMGAWPFYDHSRDFARSVRRGLFGGIVVLPAEEYSALPSFPLPPRLVELIEEIEHHHPSVRSQMTAADHTGSILDLPPELRDQVLLLDELTHAPQLHLIPKPPRPLHVPLFLHRMSGVRSTPVFESEPIPPDQTFTTRFTFASAYNYHCGVHGRSAAGRIEVVSGGRSSVDVSFIDVSISGKELDFPTVVVGVGGEVRWINFDGPRSHRVIESGGENLPSYCFNGRCFVGNTPTILAESGQRIRWYIFNLDFGACGHNFHLHGQRWRLADQTHDARGLGPGESFVVETTTPPVLLLPPDIEKYQGPGQRPPGAKAFRLRGDFLFHCNAETHMKEGLVGLVRAAQTVWLTCADAARLQAGPGLPLDLGDNDCPAVEAGRCKNSVGGKWEEVLHVPEVTMMHAVLLANSQRVLFWGYGPQEDQSRIWDQETGLYSQPSPQPQVVTPDQNIWSGAHAYLATPEGKILVHGGYICEWTLDECQRRVPVQPMSFDTEKRTFVFNPKTLTWSRGPDTHTGRFYPTTIALGDGRILTLFGEDTATGITAKSLEVFHPGSGDTLPYWSKPKDFPSSFNYFYYPWTFLLPDGNLFVAGPRQPSRRFDWTCDPIDDEKGWSFAIPVDRGDNMNGTAVLLPLDPPDYKPRVLIAGGLPDKTQHSAEWIDLSVDSPTWERLPDMNVARIQLSSVILPDGRIFVAGGCDIGSEGGPAELFDPEAPEAGWQLGPTMKTTRRYHSVAILLADGSVLVGGDTGVTANRAGAGILNERYLPPYFFKPRPAISKAPANLLYEAEFSVEMVAETAIEKVVLMSPGAVTHGFNASQRCVGCTLLPKVAGASVRAQAPPKGNVAPPGYYLLFLIDADRVPSSGVWIWLGEAP